MFINYRYSDGTGGEEIYVGHRLIFINHPQVDNPTVVTEQISIVLISVISKYIHLLLTNNINYKFKNCIVTKILIRLMKNFNFRTNFWFLKFK